MIFTRKNIFNAQSNFIIKNANTRIEGFYDKFEYIIVKQYKKKRYGLLFNIFQYLIIKKLLDSKNIYMHSRQTL